jgi:hypothetical protein
VSSRNQHRGLGAINMDDSLGSNTETYAKRSSDAPLVEKSLQHPTDTTPTHQQGTYGRHLQLTTTTRSPGSHCRKLLIRVLVLCCI